METHGYFGDTLDQASRFLPIGGDLNIEKKQIVLW